MRHGGEEFAVRPYLYQRAFRNNLVELRVVLHDLLSIVFPARGDFEIADNGRRISWAGGKCKRSDGIQRLQHVALPVHDSAAEIRIEIMLLHHIPRKKLGGL